MPLEAAFLLLVAAATISGGYVGRDYLTWVERVVKLPRGFPPWKSGNILFAFAWTLEHLPRPPRPALRLENYLWQYRQN